jgi:hypothetical protein
MVRFRPLRAVRALLGATLLLASGNGCDGPQNVGPCGTMEGQAPSGVPGDCAVLDAFTVRASQGDVVQLADGTLLAAWTRFEGSGDHDPAGLLSRRSTDGGRTWSPAGPLFATRRSRHQYNPSFLRQAHSLAVFFVQKRYFGSWIFADIYLAESTDEGQTWGPPRKISGDANEYRVVNNARVVRLASGRILVPVARVFDGAGSPERSYTSFVLYSDDDGATWARSEAVSFPSGAEEPGAIELKDGRVMMYFRHGPSLTDRRIVVAYSSDGGQTWSAPSKLPLASPCSPATIARLPNGDLVVVWNPVLSGATGPRTPLSFTTSSDDGITWRRARRIEAGADQSWEFGYASVLPLPLEGGLVLTYSAYPILAKRIQKVRVIPLSWFDPIGITTDDEAELTAR